MPEDRPPRPADGIYRAILRVMVGTVMVGAFVAIAGETVYRDPELSRLGAIIAFIAAGIYAFFRVLGVREARRRARDADDDRGAGP